MFLVRLTSINQQNNKPSVQQTMNIKTAKDVELFVNNPNNIKVVTSLFQMTAFVETVRGVIETKQKDILSFYQFDIAHEWVGRGVEKEKILKPSETYLLDEQDFNIYLSELKKFYFSDECPFKPSKPDNCPLLEAESKLRDIKREIADYFEPYFGFGYEGICGNLENYRKYYDLLMSMFAHKVKESVNA